MANLTEHTEWDIGSINFGNYILDTWLKDEAMVKRMIGSSAPTRYCLKETLASLIRLGEVSKDYDLSEYIEEAKKWNCPEPEVKSVAKCILVISVLAEKRLAVTIGV